jgi:hypothetical protein
MLRYITNILLLLLLSATAFAQEADTTDNDKPAVNYDSLKQLRFGVDISKPILNALIKSRQSYEVEVDYYHKKELYFAAEAGWGSADVTDSAKTLVYNSSNVFLKAGINKAMLPRMSTTDWDMLFLGARYGIAFINRSDASYTTYDNFWGSTTGTIPAKNYTAHWAEITAGIKVELVRGFFAGYNVRARFLLNKKSFKELPPAYIAGYGRGDKGSIFDFNLYLNYAIRWPKGGKPVAPVLDTKPSLSADSVGTSNTNRPLKDRSDRPVQPTDSTGTAPANTGKRTPSQNSGNNGTPGK